ncbi:MAG: hypothetical protein AB2768_16670 [Candidatus Thiodiazotropha endolucinida]
MIADGPLARCGPSMYTGLVGVTKPGEPVLYYLEDGLLQAVSVENFWWFPQTLSYHWMGSSGVEDCSSWFLVAFQSRQVIIVTGVV